MPIQMHQNVVLQMSAFFLTHTLTHMGKTAESARERRFAFSPALFSFSVFLHDLRHKIPHHLSGFILLLPGGMGVGFQGEACIVVPQHSGDGFDVHTVLQSHCCEGVPKVMEPNMR